MMKVAFLDRDGVINRDEGYTHKIEQFEFIEGTIESLKRLLNASYSIIIITNQSGIGRGLYAESEYEQLTHWYKQELKNKGIQITDIFHCPHHPDDNCECRKPLPGLFQQAAKLYDIDFSSSIMIGDKISDIQAADAAGIPNRYLISSNLDNALLQCVSENIAIN